MCLIRLLSVNAKFHFSVLFTKTLTKNPHKLTYHTDIKKKSGGNIGPHFSFYKEMHSRWEEGGRGGERLAKPGVILIYEAPNRYKNDNKTNCE